MKRNKGARHLHETFLVWLAAIAISLSLLAFGQTESDRWLVLANGEKGPINSQTSREELVREYGAMNVVDRDVDVGEGEMESATFLFPNDPERQIKILWKDPDAKTEPQSADIFLVKKSRWHGAHGITIGTSVSELERLNGRPFRFTLKNDGTDMAEELISWRGGSLEKEFQGEGRIILELQWSPGKGAKPIGPSDIDVNSDNPTWRAEDPHVSRMTWIFSASTNR